MIARDTVEANGELVVYPNEGAPWDPLENTAVWNGFQLPPAWFIEKSLGEIINNNIGYIRTQYPQETYLQRLRRAPTGPQSMTINVSRDANGDYEFWVTIGQGARMQYDVDVDPSTHDSMVYLQSHWGSGVIFEDMNITKK